MADPNLSMIEILAVDLALEAERAGIPIRQIAKPSRCSVGLIDLAEQVRAVVAEMRHELHADAAELGMSEDELDAAFRNVLAGMLGGSGSVH